MVWKRLGNHIFKKESVNHIEANTYENNDDGEYVFCICVYFIDGSEITIEFSDENSRDHIFNEAHQKFCEE